MRLRTLTVIVGAAFAITVGAVHVYAQTLGTSTRIAEGTCASTGATGIDILCADSSDHVPSILSNNGRRMNLPQTFFTTGTYSNASSTFSDLPLLVFNVSASRNYFAECDISWTSSSTAAGPKYQWVGPGNPFTAVESSLLSPITSSTFVTTTVASYSTTMANTGVVSAGLLLTDHLTFRLINGALASGTVKLQAAATGSGTLQIPPGATCHVQ